ncbi:hypothetical protein CFOL_v3_15190 [Cephalotus follicularis]|uniref:Uncharacterized protein n=1 Tax=Cephalotus follicularis TaxID=3775 RepID=A0A1Q3BUP6_CEPFO|nr:hypothetical protein CFOL_v3_15190 [Cephalotus follicularis]
MKDNQTPQKEQSRSSDLGNRKSKESQSKKSQKITKKSLNGAFSSVSEDISSKESIDLTMISMLSNANRDGNNDEISVVPLISGVQSSSATFKPSDLTPTSKIDIIKNEAHDDSFDVLEAEIVANFLKKARPQVLSSVDVDTRTKKLMDALIRTVIDDLYVVPEERDWITELVEVKTHIVLLCFLLWIIAMTVIFFVGSGGRSSSRGPLPT